jgi:hypothetical protein
MYKLYLDDHRKPADSAKKFPELAHLYECKDWIMVSSFDEFTRIIRYNWEHSEFPSVISFDHDLHVEHTKWYFENGGHDNPPNPNDAHFVNKTGEDCLFWLISHCEATKMPFPECYVHSANPKGRENLEKLIAQYQKFLRKIDGEMG